MVSGTSLAKRLSSLSTAVLVALATHAAAATPAVNLGTAGNFTVLSKTGISTTGTTAILGNIGVSPIDATGITGFGLILDSSNQFATSSLVNGRVYAADYAPPTPTAMTTAVGDMQIAYTDAAGRTLPDATELGAGDIGGMTLAPGLYKWSSGVTIPADVTLAGGAYDVWIFQIAQTLTVSSAAKVLLSGGALAKNVFWQVAGQATLGTTAVFNGNILCQTAIVLNTGATLNGKALAQSAVTLDANVVTSSPVSIPVVTASSGPVAASVMVNPADAGGSYAFTPAVHDATGIAYTMADAGTVTIRIYNAAGRLVSTVTDAKPAGVQTSSVETAGLSPGVYFYLMEQHYDSGKTVRTGSRKFVVRR